MAVDRPHPVVEFPGVDSSDPAHGIVDVLRRALGKVAGIVDVCVFFDAAGHTVPAGGTTTVTGATANLNTADANLNEMRVVVDGSVSAGTLTVDVSDGTTRCSVALDTTLASRVGEWAKIPVANADTQFLLRVIGDGAASLTLYSAHVQFRTSAFQH